MGFSSTRNGDAAEFVFSFYCRERVNFHCGMRELGAKGLSSARWGGELWLREG